MTGSIQEVQDIHSGVRANGDLYQNGKGSAISKRLWSLRDSFRGQKMDKQSESTGSFTEKDNRTDEENELIELRKRNKQLEMENDI